MQNSPVRHWLLGINLNKEKGQLSLGLRGSTVYIGLEVFVVA
jgi:hypothetical protein